MARNKKIKKSRFESSKRLQWVLILLVIVCIIGLLRQAYPTHFDRALKAITELWEGRPKPLSTPEPATPQEKAPKEEIAKDNEKANEKVKIKEKDLKKRDESKTIDLTTIKSLEIPAQLKDRPCYIAHHMGFSLSYNEEWRIANWVSYELTKEEIYGEEKRTNKFIVDPKIRLKQATAEDYKKSGYDRGHLAPAGDMVWSEIAMKESFYYTNMCPQAPSLNRGIWKKLEEKTRAWALKDSAIIVVSGPIVKDSDQTIGPNRVRIPSGFYKVILSPFGEKVKAIGFLFKNEGSLNALHQFAVSVDSVQKVTGIDFFHHLPDPIEQRVETTLVLSDWF